jgi:hypothetical protein
VEKGRGNHARRFDVPLEFEKLTFDAHPTELLPEQNFFCSEMSWQIIPLKGRVRCFRSLSASLDDLARRFSRTHGTCKQWPNALADRDLLSWLCLQTRFRQILEGARIVDRLEAKLLQRFSGKRRAPTCDRGWGAAMLSLRPVYPLFEIYPRVRLEPNSFLGS